MPVLRSFSISRPQSAQTAAFHISSVAVAQLFVLLCVCMYLHTSGPVQCVDRLCVSPGCRVPGAETQRLSDSAQFGVRESAPTQPRPAQYVGMRTMTESGPACPGDETSAAELTRPDPDPLPTPPPSRPPLDPLPTPPHHGGGNLARM